MQLLTLDKKKTVVKEETMIESIVLLLTGRIELPFRKKATAKLQRQQRGCLVVDLVQHNRKWTYVLNCNRIYNIFTTALT